MSNPLFAAGSSSTTPDAGSILAQKAAFIANQLGLDPSLPLDELMAAAHKKVGMKMAKHSDAEVQHAERLISAAKSKPSPRGSNKQNVGPAEKMCKSCGRATSEVCAANGCCARCLYEITHFESLGTKATSKSDAAALERAGGANAGTYGEMTPLGFRQLAARLKSDGIGLGPDDVFVDCGSGTGRLVLQALKEFGVQRAIGVELSAERHKIALEWLAASEYGPSSAAARRKKKKAAAKGGGAAIVEPASFLCSDLALPRLWTAKEEKHEDGDGALVGATVVFTCSIMFDEPLMVRLAKCIEACPTVRVVATFQRFPELKGFVEVLPPERCESSWTAPRQMDTRRVDIAKEYGSAVYIYKRGEEQTPLGWRQRVAESLGGSKMAPPAETAGGLLTLASSKDGRSEWRFL